MALQGTYTRFLYSMFLMGVVFCFGFIAVADEQVNKQKSKEATKLQENISSQSAILTGFVEGFTMDRLYIDGADYVLARGIEYYSSFGNPVTKAIIKRGCRIKYVLSSVKEVEIIQMERGQDDDEW